jgi:hypothetical protein
MDRGQRAGAVEAAVALLEVLGAPVVVHARLDAAEVDVGRALEPEHRRGVQDRDVDPVGVHVGQAQRRRPSRGPGVAVGELPVPDLVDLLVGEARGAGESVRLHPPAVPHRVLDPVASGLEVPDPVAVLGRREVEHGRRRLEDVAVGIDVPERGLVGRRHLVLPVAREIVDAAAHPGTYRMP